MIRVKSGSGPGHPEQPPRKMNKSEGQVITAALMPHAPVLVPAVGGKRGNQAAASVGAMAEAARRVVRAGPETIVLISPHTPRRRESFAIWAGNRISGSLAQFGAPAAAVDLPADETLAGMIAEEAGSRGVKIWRLRDAELDHGAVVPLWHLADAGWRGPTVVIGLNYPGRTGLDGIGRGHRRRVATRGPARRRGGQRRHEPSPAARRAGWFSSAREGV